MLAFILGQSLDLALKVLHARQKGVQVLLALIPFLPFNRTS